MTFASNLSHYGFMLRERIEAGMKAAAQRRAQRRVYSQTVYELQSMTDLDLNDIGIKRASIKAIAHEAAYGTQR